MSSYSAHLTSLTPTPSPHVFFSFYFTTRPHCHTHHHFFIFTSIIVPFSTSDNPSRYAYSNCHSYSFLYLSLFSLPLFSLTRKTVSLSFFRRIVHIHTFTAITENRRITYTSEKNFIEIHAYLYGHINVNYISTSITLFSITVVYILTIIPASMVLNH